MTLLILFTFGCKKEEEPIEYRISYVNTDMLSKYLFNKGSYWIYENQNNNIDSIIVNIKENGITTIPCPHGCPEKIISQNEFYSMTFFNVTKNISYNNFFMSDHIKINGGGDYSQNGQPIFLYNKPINYEFNGATILEKNDTLTILGTKYNNITKVMITASKQYQQEFLYDTYLYFAENIGLIKKEIHDTINGFETWSLKRYLVIK